MEDRGASIIKNTVQYFNADINMGISRAGTKERFHQMFQEAETARLKGFFHNGNVWTYDETLKLPRESIFGSVPGRSKNWWKGRRRNHWRSIWIPFSEN